MIYLTENLPYIYNVSAELIKIRCLYDMYKGDDRVMFWCQDVDRAVIAMTDGNMIIHNNGAETEELKEFVKALSPVCIFGDLDTLTAIGHIPKEVINIMSRKADIEGETVGDRLSSEEIYELLDVDGLSLPEYPYFAVDYCRRINRGGADSFGLKNKCAAISFKSGDLAIINGIAAKEKGFGKVALKAILQRNYGKTLYVCCRDNVKGFYLKNGFTPLYYGGYWVKTNEYK